MTRYALVCGVALAMGFASSPVRANHHAWNFNEVFSNWDGSVQFVEYSIPNNNNHHVLSTRGLEATSIVAGVPTVKTFMFPANLPSSSTANKKFLIASPGFGLLAGGVTPDYTFPLASMPFFLPNADSISLKWISATLTVDSPLTFTGALLPNDGETSLTDLSPNGTQNLQPGINSPTNFAGQIGSVDLPVPEPASATLACLAAAGLWAKSRRRVAAK